MADVASTNRGLNALLANAVDGGNDMSLPQAQSEPAQFLADFSTKALFLDDTRGGTTKLLQASAQKEAIVISDDNWHSIDIDPEAHSIKLKVIDHGKTTNNPDTLEISTVPGGSAHAGIYLVEGTWNDLFLGAAPLSRFYIRRTDFENTGNGSRAVTLTHIAYGSRKMLNASNKNAGVAHS